MLEIRFAQKEDLEQVITIEEANFPPGVATSRQAFAQRLDLTADSFLVALIEGEIVGFIEGPVISRPYLTDDLFHRVQPNPARGGYLAVTSLAIAPSHQGQGLGTALLAAYKDLAISQGRLGICLTCQEHLIAYYEVNGFQDQGQSQSQHGGLTWYDMVWENSENFSQDPK